MSPGSRESLRLRRGMVMSDAPYAIPLDDHHGKTRGRWKWFAILQTAGLVKACNYNRTVAQHDSAPLADHVLEAAPFQGRKKLQDGLKAVVFDVDWALSWECGLLTGEDQVRILDHFA
jgi:hypothetical protein